MTASRHSESLFKTAGLTPIYTDEMRICPAGRASYAEGGHLVPGIPLRVGLPLVGR